MQLVHRHRAVALAASLLIVAACSPSTASADADSFLAAGWGNADAVSASSPDFIGTMQSIAAGVVDADAYWSEGFDGSGVDIALVDTGTVPVSGLAGRVTHGPDFSLEAPFPNLLTLDAFGHGTHLAGIVAGNPSGSFTGVAPAANVVSVKVGAHNGAVDVSQVIAAIDWVIDNRTTDGRNIRVMLLAYGTDSVQVHTIDPLSHAVERAWHSGIVVVVAVGNDGNHADVRNPATNPFVIAVGASNPNGTIDTGDDSVAEFSACGSRSRGPDLVAPGSSILSLRAPGSYLDVLHPEARVGDDHFLGSGTSQAAAIVAGASALVLDQHPHATPDEVKHHLTSNAVRLQGSSRCQGAGQLDLGAALSDSLKQKTQSGSTATGDGSLEAARGSFHLTLGDETLVGEVSLFEWGPYLRWVEEVVAAIESGAWTGNSWGGNSWGGNSWGGNSWGGNSWGSNSWS